MVRKKKLKEEEEDVLEKDIIQAGALRRGSRGKDLTSPNVAQLFIIKKQLVTWYSRCYFVIKSNL